MADISIAEAKIYILYLVRAVPGISFHMLEENSADSLYMNYFTFNQAYDELTAGNLIDKHFEMNGITDALGGTETLSKTAAYRALGARIQKAYRPHEQEDQRNSRTCKRS